MVRVTLRLCAIPPLVAVMVSVTVPWGLLLLLAMVSVDAPVPPAARVTGLGLNDAVVLPGRPVTLSVTLPWKPFVDVRATE